MISAWRQTGRLRAGGASATLVALLALSGCAALPFGRPPAASINRAVAVNTDLGGAAALVSAFRRQNGLPPVVLSPALNRAAQIQADAMAREDAVSHDLAGGFQARMRAGGYQAMLAAENISAGHRSFADAMAGWEASSGHRTNLLRPGITEIGAAVATRPDTRRQVYWVLVMAAPASGGGFALPGGYGGFMLGR